MKGNSLIHSYGKITVLLVGGKDDSVKLLQLQKFVCIYIVGLLTQIQLHGNVGRPSYLKCFDWSNELENFPRGNENTGDISGNEINI